MNAPDALAGVDESHSDSSANQNVTRSGGVDAEAALAGTVTSLDDDALERLTHHPLDSIEQEYPHHGGAVDGPDETVRPREEHPVFFGCFDWHSADTTGDDDLAADAAETARRFYADDVDAPIAYEPLGWDFLSPTLSEANLMGRVLDEAEYADWLGEVLPDLTAPRNESFLDPVDAEGESGMALHLVGLNLAKAWGLAETAKAVDGETADLLTESAECHLEAGLDGAFTDDYAGAHWLSSFVLYALTRNVDGR